MMICIIINKSMELLCCKYIGIKSRINTTYQENLF